MDSLDAERGMFLYRLIGVAVALAIIVGCSPRENSGNAPEPNRAPLAVKNQSSAESIVKEYIKGNNIDISGLEFLFVKTMDTKGKATSLPAGFGSEIWVVRYAPVRKQGDGVTLGEAVTLGGGILFWVDAASGKVQMTRERD